MSIPCSIVFYKNNDPVCNITTGDLSTTEILDVLKTIMGGFAKKMYAEAAKACGTDDLKIIEEYLNVQLKLDRKDINDILDGH